MSDVTAKTIHESGSERTKHRTLLVFLGIGLLFVGVLISRGNGGAWSARAVGLIFTILDSGWAPLLYMLGALGLGRIGRGWFGVSEDRWVVELGIGLTLMLSLTHLLGMLGLLTTLSACGLTLVGLGMLVPDLRRWHREGLLETARLVGIGLNPVNVGIMCACLLALVMSANPPGVLWASEYGGFDALSYHLQLPREWIENGRIWPSDHNVYSYLPGYIEGAYAHMALLMGGGMLAHQARAAMSAQLLSVLMLVACAGAVGVLTKWFIRGFAPVADARTGMLMGVVLTLCTPWMLVVGTLAYNELAVVLLGAIAVWVALRTDVAPTRRAIICALLVGGACSCKPTAIFLLAPAVGIVLLACSHRKHWVSCIILCVVVGAFTVCPWLIRNALATGNPVFPHLSGVFGLGHWSQSQHDVYSMAHHFDGTLMERVRLLVFPDEAGMDHVSRFRGLTNIQWGLTPALGLIGLLSLLITRTTRQVGMVALLAFGISIVAWMTLTHLQSRFLIPLAPILIVLGAVGVARLPLDAFRRAASSVVAVGLLTGCVGFSMLQFGGNPFLVLDLGPALFLGEVDAESKPWISTMNRIRSDDESIYLIGDATPFYLRGRVLYNTVYDRWLIEDMIAAHPDDPGRWDEELDKRGIDLVVVGYGEIDRYGRSGWITASFMDWIDSLGEPIEVWSDPRTGVPLRAVYRTDGPTP